MAMDGRPFGATVVLCLVLLAACRQADLPPIPAVDLAGLSLEVQEAFQGASGRVHENPFDADANGALGMLMHAYQQHGAARDAYLRAEALAPDDARWPYLRGLIESATGRGEEAVEAFSRAVALDPGGVPARIRLGESLLALNRLPESRQAFEEVLKWSPRSPAARYGLGRVLAEEGETTWAAEEYARACELAPDAGAAHYALALAYRDLGQDEKAAPHLAIYERGNHAEPPLPDPLLASVQSLRADQHWYLNEGIRLEQAGDLTAAEEHYQKAIELNPQSAGPHVNLAVVYAKTEQYEAAERHYRRALEINPDLEELHANWGKMQAVRGRWAEAAESFKRALELNPRSGDSHLNLGLALDKLGRRAEAVDHFRLALEYGPNQRLAHYQMGRYLAQNGRPREAIEHLKQTLKPQDEQTPRMLYGLAEAYVRAGENAQALDAARKALSLANKLGQAELAAAIAEDVKALESAPTL